jgi:NACHT domain
MSLARENDDVHITIPISLSNKLNGADPIRITLKYDAFGMETEHANVLPINGKIEIPGDNKAVRFTVGSGYGMEVIFAGLSGLATNQDGDVILLSSEDLPYGEYQIEYGIIGDNFGHVDQIYSTRTSLRLAAHDMGKIVLEKPSVFQRLSSLLFTKESGLVGLFASMLFALGAAVKKHIEKSASDLMDALGSYGVRAAARRKFSRIYLQNLISNHKYLKLIGFNVAGLPRPLLEDVYISLRVSSHGVKFSQSGGDTKSISFADAVRRFDRLVVLGPPGAGKTTTLSYIALRFAAGNGLRSFGIPKRLLPIYLPLRRLSGEALTILGDLVDPKAQILPEEVIGEYPSGYFEQKLERGECIILLDGLDEVTDENLHRAIADRVNNFVERYPANRFVVTCRIAGWRNLLPTFTVLEADDLSREEIHRFIRGWHTAIIGLQERNRLEQEFIDTDQRDKHWQESFAKIRVAIDDYSRRLLNAIDSSARILAVATNPMLLSLICLVHLNRNILPRGRALLYAQCVEFLIDAWERSKGFLVAPSRITAAQKEMVLRQIAFELHVSGKGELARRELETLVESIAAKLSISGTATELLEDIEKRSGLLVERSIDVLGFSHLTLQEYLVAKHIQMNPGLAATLLSSIDNREWREVVLLYAGLIEDASDLIKRLLTEQNLDRVALAGHCIGEAQRVEQNTVGRVVTLLSAYLEKEAEGPQVDNVINALASVTADYVADEPVTNEQRLASVLIEWVQAKNSNSSAAVAILGRARTTRALPLLVKSMIHDENLRVACLNSVVLFGNFAVDPIEHEMLTCDNLPLMPVKTFLEPLFMINTGYAAVSIAKLFDRYEDDASAEAISATLALMLNQPLIEGELLNLADSELSASVSKQTLQGRAISVPRAGKEPTPAYMRLCEMIIFHLSRAFSRGCFEYPFQTREYITQPTIWLTFPSLLAAIHNADKPLPETVFSSLGFDTALLQEQGSSIDSLSRAIRKEEVDVTTVLRYTRTHREGSRLFEETASQKIFRWSISSFISILYLFNILLMITFLSLVITGEPTQVRASSKQMGVILSAIGLVIYLLIVVWYIIRQWGKFRLASVGMALLTPVQNVLARISHSGINPWLLWGCFVTALEGFLLTGLIGGILFTKELLFFYCGVGVIFVTLCAIYFGKFALRTSATSLLLSLHPRGRDLVMS